MKPKISMAASVLLVLALQPDVAQAHAGREEGRAEAASSSSEMEPFTSESPQELMQMVLRNLSRAGGNDAVFGPLQGMVRRRESTGTDYQFLEYNGEGVKADRMVYVRFDNHDSILDIQATIDDDSEGELTVSRIDRINYRN